MNTKTQSAKKVVSKGATTKVVNDSKVVNNQNELTTAQKRKATNEAKKKEREAKKAIEKALAEKIEADKKAIKDAKKLVIDTKKKQLEKDVNGLKIQPTTAYINKVLTIERLQNKDSIGLNELVTLESAKIHIEDLSPSKLYKRLQNDLNEHCLTILQGFDFPEFKDFLNSLPTKYAFSINDGLKTIAKFNTNAQRVLRATKQQTKQDAI